MKSISSFGILFFLVFLCLVACKKKSDGPYFATGIKVGEVTMDEAIIWVRLTADSLPTPFGSRMPEIEYRDPDTGKLISGDDLEGNRNRYVPVVHFPAEDEMVLLEGATTGMEGDVMVYYRPRDTLHWEHTDWISVDPNRDFTTQILLTELQSDTDYELEVVSRYPNSTSIGESIRGGFRTAPEPEEISNVRFAVTTGQAYVDQDAPEGGFRIYSSMLELDIDFFVHTGDILYYDNLAKTQALARWHWSRMYSLPTNYQFHRYVSSYFIKDDHDTWINDCWPGYSTEFMGTFTFEQGQRIFLEQVPMRDLTYRTYRWGRDLQIWLMEGRDFRSPNTAPDGPEKTIWGEKQKKWLFNTVNASDATFKLLISPTPIVGPDRLNKHDNHSNSDFSHEGKQIRNFIAENKDMFVVCGDRHWQYISIDDETGIREFSCGPASDAHAGGWSNDQVMPEHEYLNVTGGFLAGEVTRIDQEPLLIFTHYSVDGLALHSDTLRIR